MKKFLYVTFLFITFNSFGQDLFEYKFDDHFSLNIPDNAEEVETSGQVFIRGYIDEDMVIINKSDKGLSKISDKEKADLARFYQGVKDGILKASKGKVVKEEMIEIDSVQAFNFRYSMSVNNISKLVDSYTFVWKGFAYSIQFMSSPEESDNFKTTKKKIIESININ